MKFGEWLEHIDFRPVTESSSPSEAVERLHDLFAEGINSYKEITRKKKSSEPEWMADWIVNDIEDRRKVFKTDQGRSSRWRAIKKKTAAVIKKRKSNYNAFILKKFENEKNPGKFFHHLKCLEGKNLGPRWSPTDMFPGEDAQEVAEKLATFFNAISDEYTPLNPDGVPRSFNQRVLPYLSVDQVATAMKEAKKLSLIHI